MNRMHFAGIPRDDAPSLHGDDENYPLQVPQEADAFSCVGTDCSDPDVLPHSRAESKLNVLGVILSF